MASTTGDGALQVLFKKYKLTLYLAQDGRRVLGVTFHDTTSWCHVITWTCILIPDEYSPNINLKFLQQLSALKEKFATHGRLTRIQIDRRMFVFRHETEAKAIEMLGSYTLIEEIILKFLRETGAQVTDIKMKSEVDEAAASIDQETLPRGTTDQDVLFSSKHGDDVDAPHSHPQQRHDDISHAQKDEDAAHLSTGSVTKTGMSGNSRADKSVSAGQINTNAINQDNRTVNSTIIINLPSGKAVCESCWKAKHENIPQPTDIDIETVKTLLNELFSDSLVRVRWECMVFCFEHESMEDAMGMIVQHADIKKDILHFLHKLDPSINDIVMEVEVRELCESEELTAQTSGSGSHSSVYSSESHSSVYTSSDPSRRRMYPWLSTASHATPTQADRDLFYASKVGDLEEVKRLLTTPGIDVDCRVGGENLTPVMAAARYGHREMVELLKSEGVDASLVDEDRNNILHYACMGGDVETVKYVLSLNVVNINSRGWWSLAPVMEAAYKGQREVVELLVSKGADMSLVDKDGENILHLACMGGDVETVKYVLSLNVADINSRGWRSKTPVMEAAYKGHREVVELLVSKGADVSKVDEDGNNILHYACMGGDVETVKYVLSLNVADINSRGWSSKTPVMEAAYKGPREVVELLVSKGADASLVNKVGNNILHYACMGGDVETVKYVLSLNVADINSRGWWSKTPVMGAAYKGPREVVELLVSKGADVSLVDEDGENILHLACMGGDVETVKYVLSLNVADIDARNRRGLTAADVARRGERQQVVELLKSRGAH